MAILVAHLGRQLEERPFPITQSLVEVSRLVEAVRQIAARSVPALQPRPRTPRFTRAKANGCNAS